MSRLVVSENYNCQNGRTMGKKANAEGILNVLENGAHAIDVLESGLVRSHAAAIASTIPFTSGD